MMGPLHSFFSLISLEVSHVSDVSRATSRSAGEIRISFTPAGFIIATLGGTVFPWCKFCCHRFEAELISYRWFYKHGRSIPLVLPLTIATL
jgi:hypothetical protein